MKSKEVATQPNKNESFLKMKSAAEEFERDADGKVKETVQEIYDKIFSIKYKTEDLQYHDDPNLENFDRQPPTPELNQGNLEALQKFYDGKTNLSLPKGKKRGWKDKEIEIEFYFKKLDIVFT